MDNNTTKQGLKTFGFGLKRSDGKPAVYTDDAGQIVQASDTDLVELMGQSGTATQDEVNKAVARKVVALGAYVDNPEFVRVYTDSDEKILWAIKANGDIYFGAGVPQQIIDYITSHIDILEETLETLIATKVDKVEGKSLVNSEYANGVSYTENPEFVCVKTDNEGKILWAIKTDGGIYYGAGIPQQVIDYINEKIAELSLDEYEDIVDFLGSIINKQPIFSKKKVSIIGDSISTFAGYIPIGYSSWYPHEGDRSSDVVSVNDTWWEKLIDATNSTLEVNASWSGSRVTTLANVPNFDDRVSVIGNPEVIIIALGTNDSSNNVEIGDIDFNADSYDLTKFAPAYIKGLQDTLATYPNARIICIAFDMAVAYQNAINTIANHYGIDYIYVGDISDVHPNKAEMQAVYERIYNTWSLAGLLSNKVDKEEGKSLIPTQYIQEVNNSEYIEAKTDSEGKFLEGIRGDGTRVFGAGVEIHGKQTIDGVECTVISNPEWIAAWIDAEEKILIGIKVDGSVYCGNINLSHYLTQIVKLIDVNGANGVDWDALRLIFETNNPKYIKVEVDSEGKVLAGRTTDGTAVEMIGLSTPGLSVADVEVNDYDDHEERMEVKTDIDNKVISYRDKHGVLHEVVGVETNHLGLTEQGVTDLQRALGLAGFNKRAVMDWSDKEIVEIPLPKKCAILNFGVDSQATSKSDREDYQEGVNGDIPTTIEFWDLQGNYFKKPILLSAQGSSSMAWWIKNQGFDLDDGSTIKFGDWVAQDSFHVKKYYIDVFRGQSIVGYWLTEQMYQTRGYGERRPWDYLNQGGTTQNAIGKFNKDFDTGALAHPDGFPVHVFFNGKDAGIYAFNLKKDRDNYYQKKDNTNQIILDGTIGQSELFGGNIDWTAFEIRNPKTKKKKDGWELVDVNGDKYDGDFPEELMGTNTTGYDSSNLSHVKSADTKAVIVRLSTAYNAIVANKTKATFETYFIVPFFIDYFLISQVLYHFDGFWKNWIWCTWDGELWTPTSYDMDSIFGADTNGTSVIPAGEYIPVGQSAGLRTNTNQVLGANAGLPKMLWDLYEQEIKDRYAELRNKGIFTTKNIVGLLETWIKECGYDELKNDIENVCAVDDVPQTPSYRDGNETYSQNPTTGGFYNSILRVKRWLDEHFAYLDSSDIFNYNQN